MSYCMLASDEWFFHNLHLSIHFSFHHHFYDFYFWRDCFFSSFFGTFFPVLWVNVSSLFIFLRRFVPLFFFFFASLFYAHQLCMVSAPRLTPHIWGCIYGIYAKKQRWGSFTPKSEVESSIRKSRI